MKSLMSGLRVLSEFAGERSRWSVGALARELDIGKSHASKILAALRDCGFLEQNPETREYAPGLRAVALGSHYLNNSRLVREALGPMRRLADASGQTTTISVLDGLQVMYLAAVEGPMFLDVGYRVGTWIPFHATAAGKVLYAFQPKDVLDRALTGLLAQYTEMTICDPAAMRTHLAEARGHGVAKTRGESVSGLAAIAVPVLGANEQVVAALGFVYPAHAVTEEAEAEFLLLLQQAARSISVRLGARVYPFGKV